MTWSVLVFGLLALGRVASQWWWTASCRRRLARATAGSPSTDVGRLAGRLGLLRSGGRRRPGPADDVAPTLDRLARAVAAGATLPAALAGLGQADPARPFAAVLAGAAQQHALGLPLDAAVRVAASSAPDAPEVRLGLAVVELSARHGGATAGALDRVAAAVRERRSVVAERSAHSAQARLSATVLTALPLGFAAWMVSTDDEVARFVARTPLGWACATTGLALNGAGWVWMRCIVGRS